MKKAVVLYPSLDAGHLTPKIELAKLFLQHGVAVTVALVETPLKAHDFSAVVACSAASNPSIAFHLLPLPPLPSASSSGCTPTNTEHHLIQMLDCLKAMNAPLCDFLRSLPAVDALVIDMFCADALAVAADLELPVYYSCLLRLMRRVSCRLHQPCFRRSHEHMFRGAQQHCPFFAGSASVQSLRFADSNGRQQRGSQRHRPDAQADPGVQQDSHQHLRVAGGARGARLMDGLCVPERATLPVYCIGPLIFGGGEKEHECLQWLDSQPDRSVVFLCLGSMGTFSKRQLEEIAVRLKKSEQRFL